MVERYRSVKARNPNRLPSGRFGPGFQKPVAGRPKGSKNLMPRIIAEALVMAAELEGADGRGKMQLVGFLRRAARLNPVQYAAYLTRVIPYQISLKADVNVVESPRFTTEVLSAMTLQEKIAAYKEAVGATRPLVSKPVLMSLPVPKDITPNKDVSKDVSVMRPIKPDSQAA